jgi:hypothetical protein
MIVVGGYFKVEKGLGVIGYMGGIFGNGGGDDENGEG